jgi:2-polyprenyl-3-methyl-5-hydroxy-6-metoxy-1,4-benzoquinol methylase
MASLKTRSRQDEQMDAPDIDPMVYARVLDDLGRVNRWTFTALPTLGYLKRAARNMPEFSLLDVGFGDGDMLRAIAHWAKKRNVAARLVGVDLNPMSAGIAARATPRDLGIDYRTGDYRDQPEQFDFIISSQVAHHMTDRQLHDFLRHMESATRRGWLISDLHRHWFSHTGFPLLARIMGVHRIVREDGTLSIARSFRPEEWPPILANAGILASAVQIRRRFPFRLTVERIK